MIYNGTYTIENKETGNYRTFSITTQGGKEKFAAGKRILSLLSDTDITLSSSYKGFAFVEEDGIHVWKKYKGVGKKSHFEYYAALIQNLSIKQDEQESVKIEEIQFCGQTFSVLVSKYCRRCNHMLTTPESIKAGIGPKCAKLESEGK